MKILVFEAKLQGNKPTKLVATLEADNLSHAKAIVKEELNLNPYYHVFVEYNSMEILYNQFMTISKDELKAEPFCHKNLRHGKIRYLHGKPRFD